MTEKEIVDSTGIQSGRAFAALRSLVRDKGAVSVKRGGHSRYTVTNAGRAQVASWDVASAGQEMDCV